MLKRVGKVAYQLDLPRELKMHHVLHLSLLQLWAEGGRVQPPPPRLLTGRQLVWSIDRILDHRSGKHTNLKEMLTHWEGFDKSHDSWEPEALIHDP